MQGEICIWWLEHLNFSHLIHVAPISNISTPIVCGYGLKWSVWLSPMLSEKNFPLTVSLKHRRQWNTFAWSVVYPKDQNPLLFGTISCIFYHKLYLQHMSTPFWSIFPLLQFVLYKITFHLTSWLKVVIKIIIEIEKINGRRKQILNRKIPSFVRLI